MNVKRIHLVLSIFLLGMILSVRTSFAQTTEYKLKASWIYQFGENLIDWETSVQGQQNFVIGVLGNPPEGLLEHLNRIERLKIQSKPVEVVHYRSIEQFNQQFQAGSVNILFVTTQGIPNESQRDRLQAANTAVEDNNAPVLIVGEELDAMVGVPLSFKIENQGGSRLLRIHRETDQLPNSLQFQREDLWRRIPGVEASRQKR